MEEGLIVKLAIGALVPGTIATGVLGAVWWHHRRTATQLNDTAGAATIESQGEPFWVMPALTASLAAAMIPILTEATAFPPAAADEWLPFVAIGAGALELLTRHQRFPTWLRWTLRAILLALIAAACARNLLRNSWSAGTGAMWIAGFISLSLAATRVLELVLSRTRGITAPALLLIIVGGASQILAVGFSSLKVGQAVGVVAAVVGAACAVAIIRPRFSLAFGGSFVAVAITATGLFCCSITANDRLAHNGRVALYIACIAAATLLPGLILLRPLASLRAWKRSIAVLLLAGLPTALALAVAGKDELDRAKAEADEYTLATPLTPAPRTPPHAVP
jgi:hypothetical protein